jgi:hypothetical protein
VAVWREPIAQGQKSKRDVGKVVHIPTDQNAMQTTLRGMELVVLSMGDLTASRVVFTK